jgi:hypothetical protein
MNSRPARVILYRMRRSRKRRKWSQNWSTGRFDCTAAEPAHFSRFKSCLAGESGSSFTAA